MCVLQVQVLFDPLRARWDRSSGICRYCILYFERSPGRWRCREGQARRSLWARLHSIQHVFSSLTNPPRPLRLRWHTRGAMSALRSVVGSGIQGDGSEQKVLALWGLFSFLSSALCGFHCLAIALRYQWLLCDCSLLARTGVFVQLWVYQLHLRSQLTCQ